MQWVKDQLLPKSKKKENGESPRLFSKLGVLKTMRFSEAIYFYFKTILAYDYQR